jgi:hypothetical protein
MDNILERMVEERAAQLTQRERTIRFTFTERFLRKCERRREKQREATYKRTVKNCCAAQHMSKTAHAVYEQLVEIGKREPEFEAGLGLFCWDSELGDIPVRHLRWLESEGWIVRLSEMLPGLEPPSANGYYVFDHAEYIDVFPGCCTAKLHAPSPAELDAGSW